MRDAGLTEAGLLALYDRVAEAEDAIPRLRRFVLDLAVRGKLVPQDAEDEPASVLLERIEKEKARLVKAGEIRKAKQETSAKRSLIPFDLPPRWEPIFLGGVIDLLSGQHLQPNEYSAIEGSGVPYITGPSDFGESGLSITRFALVRKAVARRGQLLLTVKGSGVGKTTICELEEVAISRQLMALTPILWSISFLEIITDRLAEVLQGQARSLIPGIAREDVEQFAFGLPPLAEQHRIVAKVEALMALLDQLEAARAAREDTRTRLTAATLSRLTEAEADIPTAAGFALRTLPALTTREDQIKTLRQTILNLAVRGKLVEQDAGDEPADNLVVQLKASISLLASEHKRGRRNLANSERGLVESPLFEAPAGWVWVQMGELGETNIGLTYSPNDVGPQGVPVLRSNNIQGGQLDLTNLVRVNMSPRSSAMVNDGDMIICARNGSRSLVGKAAIIFGLPEPMAFGAFMAIFRSPINPYLHLFLSSPAFRSLIDEVNTTTINQITQANLRSTFVPLPPLAEQHRIVAKVEELMSLCDRLETALREAATTRARLLDATLREALSQAQEAA